MLQGLTVSHAEMASPYFPVSVDSSEFLIFVNSATVYLIMEPKPDSIFLLFTNHVHSFYFLDVSYNHPFLPIHCHFLLSTLKSLSITGMVTHDPAPTTL